MEWVIEAFESILSCIQRVVVVGVVVAVAVMASVVRFHMFCKFRVRVR